MNRVDPFFILILVLLSSLAVTYKAAEYDLSGLQFQILVNQKLQNKIQRLELQQAATQLTQPESSRQPASLPEHPEIFIEPSEQAKNMYLEAQKICEKNAEDKKCLDQIEAIISQFPETKWAGEAILLLSQVYLKSRRNEQAFEMVKYVKKEFKKFPELQSKLKLLDKKRL